MDSGGYNLGFERRDQYLYARIQADFMDLDTAKRYLREIADRVVNDDYKLLLVERDIPTMPGRGSLYYAVQAFQEYIGDRRVAFVNVYENIQDEMDFVVLLAKNNGGEFKVFDNVDEAEAWLIKD